MYTWDGAAIGEYVKMAREARGWSQRMLADRAGVSHSYVSHLEKGMYARPKVEHVEKVLKAVGVELGDAPGVYVIKELPRNHLPGPYEGEGEREEVDEKLRASFLSTRDLTPSEQQSVAAILDAMVEDLKRRRREEDEAERRRRDAKQAGPSPEDEESPPE